MRKFEVYLRINGRAFDIDQFQAYLPASHRGWSKPIYRMVGAHKKVIGAYWCSDSVAVAESGVNRAALSQLQNHHAGLTWARSLGAERIYLCLAMNRHATITPKPVALSRSVQAHLDWLGAEVDMNVPQHD